MTPSTNNQPNPDILIKQGWQVATVQGAYCVAWQGKDEVVFVWTGQDWHRVAGKGNIKQAG